MYSEGIGITRRPTRRCNLNSRGLEWKGAEEDKKEYLGEEANSPYLELPYDPCCVSLLTMNLLITGRMPVVVGALRSGRWPTSYNQVGVAVISLDMMECHELQSAEEWCRHM